MSAVLSNLFSRDPTSSFAYEVSQKFDSQQQTSGFSQFRMSKTRRKGTNDEFTLFTVDFKSIGASDAEFAKGCAKRLKILKHPAVLTFVDNLETESLLYIVTESCIPLSEYLENLKTLEGSLRLQLISWGIYQIATGLNFLNQEAKLVHDNINVNSVFVTKCGDWKLFGLEYTRPTSEAHLKPRKLPNLLRYSYPDSRLTSRSPPWALDCWGLACLIWDIFNGAMPDTDNAFAILKAPKSIDKSLHASYAKLISSNPCSPLNFIELCRQRNNFMDNKLVDFLLCLEQFQIKETSEKSRFFTQYNAEFIASLPENMLKYKVLPQLLNIYEFGEAGVKVLTPVLQIGKLLSEAEYQRDISPCIVKLFATPDRMTRVKLLKEVENFINYLSPAVVNDKIFPHFISGLSDTNPAVRENTLKAVIHVAPKLNYNNLNVELMKHLARLQSKDDQPGIRTNATVCLGKIAVYLDVQVRRKILITAFTRPFGDPFAPARLAGVLALTATEQFYTTTEIGQKILPQLCSLSVDNDKQVRDPAFKAIRGFLDKVQHAVEHPEVAAEMSERASKGRGVENASQWASWALSALGSRFYKQPAPSPDAASVKSTDDDKKVSSNEPKRDQSPVKAEKVVEPIDDMEDTNERWDDDRWESLEKPTAVVSHKPATVNLNRVTAAKSSNGWDLEDWPDD